MSYLSPIFIIGDIHIGSIEGASCFNMGNNFPTGFKSYKKHNQGFGSITGDNNNLEEIDSLLSDSSRTELIEELANDHVPELLRHLGKQSRGGKVVK